MWRVQQVGSLPAKVLYVNVSATVQLGEHLELASQLKEKKKAPPARCEWGRGSQGARIFLRAKPRRRFQTIERLRWRELVRLDGAGMTIVSDLWGLRFWHLGGACRIG